MHGAERACRVEHREAGSRSRKQHPANFTKSEIEHQHDQQHDDTAKDHEVAFDEGDHIGGDHGHAADMDFAELGELGLNSSNIGDGLIARRQIALACLHRVGLGVDLGRRHHVGAHGT